MYNIYGNICINERTPFMPTLFVVATPIGNLSDISPRALETLQNVSLIAAEDTSHTIKLLNHFEIKTHMISYHKYNESERASSIISKMLDEDIDVAIVTDAGTPCISDPGYDLIAAARENGINVIGVPGACAAVTALSISGFPVDRFAFYGFLERDKKESLAQLKRIEANEVENIIIYESPFRIIDTLQSINDALDCKVCICNDLTKLHESTYSAHISEALEYMKSNANAEKGEYVIIIHKESLPQSESKSNAVEVCPEALIVNEMITNGITAKDAVAKLKKETTYSKKELFAASLRLKELFCDDEDDE
ncbi:MAG: 16S rRNA (cytidine(1402)-2'-O)-methyltransferase [Clostridiales bacterium]|nr:16S rRNA (cytidine(1402)-2'-O)-methyltransferase [Clostridiales bacterium]